MAASRLSRALEQGALVLPETGRIALFNPPADVDPGGLDPARLHCIQPFRPDHDALSARALSVSAEPQGPYGAAIVFIPRARDWARALVEQAARLAPLVVLDGQKTDGCEPLIGAVRARTPLLGTLSKGHGKLAWFAGGDFSDWREVDRHLPGDWLTRPGIFSADGPDPGSQALADALPTGLAGHGADLGAGWGFLARAVLARDAVRSLDLIEADARALDCARQNLSDSRARFLWADARDHRPEAPYDFIVSNPPFHAGRRADPGLGQDFIAAAARMLAPSGQLVIVANRHLPYEGAMDRSFAETGELTGTPGFKILRGARPRRQRRR